MIRMHSQKLRHKHGIKFKQRPWQRHRDRVISMAIWYSGSVLPLEIFASGLRRWPNMAKFTFQISQKKAKNI